MKFRGTIHKAQSTGGDVAFTVTNVRQKGAAEWREYGAEVTFQVTEAQARAFPIGREVEIEVRPKR